MNSFALVPDADPILDVILRQKDYEKCDRIFKAAKKIICFRYVRNQVEDVIHKDVVEFNKFAWMANRLAHENTTKEEYRANKQKFEKKKNCLKSRGSGLFEEKMLNLDISQISVDRITELTLEIQHELVQFFHAAEEKFKEQIMLKPRIKKINYFINNCKKFFIAKFKNDPPKEIEHSDEIILALFLELGLEGEERSLKFLTSDTGIISMKKCLSKSGNEFINEKIDYKISWDIVAPKDFFDYN